MKMCLALVFPLPHVFFIFLQIIGTSYATAEMPAAAEMSLTAANMPSSSLGEF